MLVVERTPICDFESKMFGKFKRAKRGSRLIVASKSNNGKNGENEDVPFRLTGRGATYNARTLD